MSPAQFIQLIVLAAIWGASFLFTRIAVPEFGPVWLVALRVLAAALFLFVTAALWRRRLPLRGNMRHFLILGLLNTALPFFLFSLAAKTLTASLLAIINSTAPLWGVLFGIVITRQPPRAATLLGLAIGSCGVGLLVLHDASALAADSWLPATAAILAPICYGLSSHYARMRTAHLDPSAVAQGSMWGAVACCLPALFLVTMPAGGNFSALSTGAWWAALALGIVCTGVAYLIYFRLIRDIGAPSALTVTFLIPLFGILWGAIFLDEVITAHTVLGAALVLLGTGLVTGFDPRTLLRRPPPQR